MCYSRLWDLLFQNVTEINNLARFIFGFGVIWKQEYWGVNNQKKYLERLQNAKFWRFKPVIMNWQDVSMGNFLCWPKFLANVPKPPLLGSAYRVHLSCPLAWLIFRCQDTENKIMSEVNPWHIIVTKTDVTDMMYNCSREGKTIFMKNRMYQPRNDSVFAAFQRKYLWHPACPFHSYILWIV